MANPEHLAELRKGVSHWNAWVAGQGPDFRADLSGALLAGSQLEFANLARADLSGANLQRANLFQADLSSADLSEAWLYGANISGANVRGANLAETRFPSEKFRLSKVDVRGADLSKAIGILKRSYTVMRGDENTKLPRNLETPAHWYVENRYGPEAPPLPASPVAHQVQTTGTALTLGQIDSTLDEATLDGLLEDLRDAVSDLRDFGNLDNQAPLLVKGVERFLLRLPDSIASLDQVRFGTGVQALSIQFEREKPVLEDVAPEKLGHLEAALMRANLIAANLPIWIEFRKDEAETEPVFEARQEDIEAILEHAAEALEADPEHFDPSLFERIREYLDDATMVGYLASKDLLLNIAHKTFQLVGDLTKDTIDAARKQVVKNIATALNVQLGAIFLDLAGILPNQLRWLVEWLEYLPKLLV